MQTLHTVADLRQALSTWTRVLLVPTMGNLHQGHLDLVANARAHADTVVASIFVNRLQFAPDEDFDRYPRTLAHDVASLAAAGCDLAFVPDEHELYPEPRRFHVTPSPGVADILEGAFRPGFFTGVETTRAPDGLALSSRNTYLSAPDRAEAPQLGLTRLRDNLEF